MLIKQVFLCLMLLPAILRASSEGKSDCEALDHANNAIKIMREMKRDLENINRSANELLEKRQVKDDLFENFKAQATALLAKRDGHMESAQKTLESLSEAVENAKLEKMKKVLAAQDKHDAEYINSRLVPPSKEPWRKPFVCNSETAYESALKTAPWVNENVGR